MASCDICARGACDTPLSREPNMKYSIGDVYSLKESVYTAIYDIFRSTFGEGSEAFNRSCDSLQDLTRSPDVIKEGRPAIIMKDDINGDNPLGLLVCLATTYSGEDISNLPSVFQHFSIPIAPNMWHGHGDHVHGLPEWEKPNAFVIGWQFRSKATREGVWMTQADGEEVPQVLGKEAMRFLVAECKRRRETWLEMCKNLVTATALEAEVNDHVNKRFYSGAGSRAVSFESVTTTGVDAPWWRRPTTIPEETENDFVLVTSGKSREATSRKFTGKHRTGSTTSFGSAWTKKGDTDKNSIKSNRSRTSLAQKAHNKGGLMNKFDVLRAVRVNVG